MYQGLSKQNTPENIWNEAKVHIITTEKGFYNIGIIWGYLSDTFSIISSVALCILTILHSHAAEECMVSVTKKSKATFRSSLDLKTPLNSIMITKMNKPESLLPSHCNNLPKALLRKCKTACDEYNKQHI